MSNIGIHIDKNTLHITDEGPKYVCMQSPESEDSSSQSEASTETQVKVSSYNPDETVVESEEVKTLRLKLELIRLPVTDQAVLSPSDWTDSFLAVLQRRPATEALVSLSVLERVIADSNKYYKRECGKLLGPDRLFRAAVEFLEQPGTLSHSIRCRLYRIMYELTHFNNLPEASVVQNVVKLAEIVTTDLQRASDVERFHEADITQVYT